MSDPKQGENLLLKNILWPLLHPLGTIRACWQWLTMPVKPPVFVLVSGVLLVISVAFCGVMGAGLQVSSPFQAILSVFIAIALWFLTLLLGLKGDLNENLHPWDLYFKSLMTGPFWFMIWAIVFHFIFQGGL